MSSHLAATPTYTDAYEPDDTQATAYPAGIYNVIPCQSPFALGNATFWRAGLTNPAYDIDWYRITLGAQQLYIVSVAQQTRSDLYFSAFLYDPDGSPVGAAVGVTNPVMTFYSDSGGTYSLRLVASNAATITGTETKPYRVSWCSSAPLTRKLSFPVVMSSFPPVFTYVMRFSPRDNIGDVPVLATFVIRSREGMS